MSTWKKKKKKKRKMAVNHKTYIKPQSLYLFASLLFFFFCFVFWGFSQFGLISF